MLEVKELEQSSKRNILPNHYKKWINFVIINNSVFYASHFWVSS